MSSRRSEILVAVENGRGPLQYQDADIIHAWSGEQIRWKHASLICEPVLQGFNADGLRQKGSVAEEWFLRGFRYRFERVGVNSVRREVIGTEQNKVLTNVADSDGEWLWVDEHVRMMIMDPRHFVFGSSGFEVWYGGEQSHGDAGLDAVWAKIENDTPLRENDHRSFPLKSRSLMKHLVLAVEDFASNEAADMMRPMLRKLPDDGSPAGDERYEVVRKRKTRSPYQSHNLPVSVDDIRNRAKRVDVRDEPPMRKRDAVEAKRVDVREGGGRER